MLTETEPNRITHCSLVLCWHWQLNILIMHLLLWHRPSTQFPNCIFSANNKGSNVSLEARTASLIALLCKRHRLNTVEKNVSFAGNGLERSAVFCESLKQTIMLQDDRTLRTGVITSAQLIKSQGLVNVKPGVILASQPLFFCAKHF